MELKIQNPTPEGFIKAIEWNHEELKAELKAKTELYTNLVYGENEIAEAKKDRANLNKFIKTLEEKRKEIKSQCLAPYDKFEKQIKELEAIVEEPIAKIDEQVKGYEEQKKQQKLEEIKAYFETVECCNFPFEAIYNPRWLNATTTMKSIQEDIDKQAETIRADMAILNDLDLFQYEAIQIYNTTLDIRAAIAESKRLEEVEKAKAEFEAQKERELEANRRELEEKQAQLQTLTEEQPEEPIATEEPEQTEDFMPDFENIKSNRTWVAFKANMDTEDIEALEWFMDARGIEYTRL